MKKSKIILQSNYLYYLLIIIIPFYIYIFNNSFKNVTVFSNIYEGTVTNITINDNIVNLIINGQEKIKGTIYLKENDFTNYLNLLGKKIRINGEIKEVNKNTIPNTFNYKKYLQDNNIKVVYIINNYEILKNENIFYYWKSLIIKRINSYDTKLIPYLNIFLLGNKSYLEEDILNNYRLNGIWHLFAISGMHINLIIMLLNKLFKRWNQKEKIISGTLVFFMFLTNYSASVLRVCIFYFLKIFLNYLQIRLSNLKILILTASLILFTNPNLFFNSGFQYSFLITLAIMLKSKSLKGNYLWKIFKISLISLLISLPITVNLNYEINILSVFLNIFYVPFISLLVFPLSLFCFFLKFLSPILNILINILEFTNAYFSNFKFIIIIPKMKVIVIILYYLILLIIYLKNKKHLFIYIFILLVINNYIPKLESSFNIYYLDVGQGDSSIIISPHQKNVSIIDTGGHVNSNYHISDNIILFLKSISIKKIDNLIITHGDYDHMGEAINLVNNFKVEKVIFNCGTFNDLEKELIKVLDKKNIKYYSCVKELNIDKNKLYFLQTKEYDNENDNSNVIYTEIDGYKFMFMGDAGVTTEKEIVNKYNLIDIDVLKIGHHGSKTSSGKEFINEVNPKYSIISVGKNNRYEHPNKEVLNNLENSKIYRTDQDGSIMFKIKNNKLEIQTCSP